MVNATTVRDVKCICVFLCGSYGEFKSSCIKDRDPSVEQTIFSTGNAKECAAFLRSTLVLNPLDRRMSL